MTPVPTAVISSVFPELGGIGNAILWSQFTQSPTPRVFVDLVRVRAAMRLARLCRFLTLKMGRMPVGCCIITMEAIVVLARLTCFPPESGEERSRSPAKACAPVDASPPAVSARILDLLLYCTRSRQPRAWRPYSRRRRAYLRCRKHFRINTGRHSIRGGDMFISTCLR